MIVIDSNKFNLQYYNKRVYEVKFINPFIYIKLGNNSPYLKGSNCSDCTSACISCSVFGNNCTCIEINSPSSAISTT